MLVWPCGVHCVHGGPQMKLLGKTPGCAGRVENESNSPVGRQTKVSPFHGCFAIEHIEGYWLVMADNLCPGMRTSGPSGVCHLLGPTSSLAGNVTQIGFATMGAPSMSLWKSEVLDYIAGLVIKGTQAPWQRSY